MATTKTTAKKTAKPTGKTGKIEHSEFHDFFVDELKDIYWAEKHLVKALPKMKKAATSPELAAAFEKHTQETEQHISTLEEVFSLLGEKAAAKKCDAMAGLLEEFVPALIHNNTHYYKKLVKLIPKQYHTDLTDIYSIIQSVLDFVSGMTDLYAVDLYRNIKGISFPSET